MTAQPAQLSLSYDPESVEAPVLAFYLQHWREKRGDRAMPPRSELRPSEIKPHLAEIALIEALPGLEDFRFRLIGTGVAQHLLAHATGKTIRETFAGAEQSYVEGIVRLHRAVCQKKMPLLVQASGGIWQGLFYPTFEVLYLPLADDAGDARFVLTAYSFPKQEGLAELRNSLLASQRPEQTAPVMMPSMESPQAG